MLRGVLLAVTVAAACGGGTQMRVTPEVGRQSGGQSLRIEGAGFSGHGPAVVYVGPRAAKMVVIQSDTLMTIMTPQTGDPTSVDIRIEFRDGTVVELPKAFAYQSEEGIVLQPEIGFGKGTS